MKKIISFTILVLSLLLVISSLVSALTVSSSTISSSSNSTTLTITNNGLTNLTGINLLSSGDFNLVFNTSSLNLIVGESKNVLATIISKPNKLGSFISTVTANTTNVSATGTVSFSKSYCTYGNVGGDLDLELDISNNKGYGDDDDEWYPLDEIEVEVSVENNGNDDLENIIIEWGLYNPSTGKWIVEEEEKDFDLDEGDDKTITFNPKITPDDYDSNYKNYVFYVKAYVDGDEDIQCQSESQSIKVSIDKNFVIVGSAEVTPDFSCTNPSIPVSLNIWNIGSKDQKDVSILVYNKDLKINKKFEVGDIDSLDNEKIDITLDLVEGVSLSQKSYNLRIDVLDEDGDIYENDNDDESYYNLIFYPNCANTTTTTSLAKADISATLESEAKSGKEAKIKVSVFNLGSTAKTYSVAVSGYSDWADSAEFDKNIVLLAASSSEDVILTLDLKSGISGEQTLKVQVLDGSSVVAEKSISLEVEKSFNLFSGNWYLWLIGAVNLILVLIIILVVIKVLRG